MLSAVKPSMCRLETRISLQALSSSSPTIEVEHTTAYSSHTQTPHPQYHHPLSPYCIFLVPHHLSHITHGFNIEDSMLPYKLSS